MTPLASRVLVAVVGLPVVLAVVYAGGWWLFTLVAIGAVLALHEYALMARSLRPVTLAAYAGALLSLLGAELGGLEWTVAGFLTTLLLAFILHWVGQTRQSATVAIASTVLGAGWIGLCLAHLILLRDIPDNGRLATFAVLLAVWAGDIGAFFAGRLIGRHKLARHRRRRRSRLRSHPRSRRARHGRASSSARSRPSSSRSSPCTRTATTFSPSARRSCSDWRCRSPRRSATCSSPASSATCR